MDGALGLKDLEEPVAQPTTATRWLFIEVGLNPDPN
jgi:hypothetical protein